MTTTSESASKRNSASSIYVESIQRSPDICSNCLSVRQDRLERRAKKTSHKQVIGDLVYARETQTTRENGAATECRNPPRFCDCGVKSAFFNQRDKTVCDDDGKCYSRTLKKETAVEFAHNLSATLTHLGYYHSTAELIDVVESLKSDPDWASKDDKIFETAVTETVVDRPTDTNP